MDVFSMENTSLNQIQQNRDVDLILPFGHLSSQLELRAVDACDIDIYDLPLEELAE